LYYVAPIQYISQIYLENRSGTRVSHVLTLLMSIRSSSTVTGFPWLETIALGNAITSATRPAKVI
jgi:hypothetical protein